MNRKLLQKVIDELLKDKPDLSYIRGIVETMLESLPMIKETLASSDDGIVVGESAGNKIQIATTDEASILDAQARIALEKFKTFNQTNNV